MIGRLFASSRYLLVVVMGVFFLGKTVSWTGENNLLYLGAGIAAVSAALTYFLSLKS